MKITDALYGEHGLFYPVFDFFEARLQTELELAEVKTMATVLGEMAVAHASVEEDLLFPALDPHLGETGPLMIMRGEHKDIDSLLQSTANAENAKAAAGYLRGLIDLLKGHFAKEEQVLFAIAQKVLDEQTQESLGARWAERRGVVITDVNTRTCFG